MPRFRRAAAMLGMVGVLLTLAAPASASSTVIVDQMRMAVTRANKVGLAPAPCQDKAYRLLGAHWTSTYEWSFRASSTPAGLGRKATAAVLRKSFSNIVNANNDCGRADNVSATYDYLGTTSRAPNCSRRDGHNVVGFARLPYGVLAVTCFWMHKGHMTEADMQINNRESWALTMAGCHGGMPLLESTITHEAGHVFGLDHVGERRHGRLTMSPYLDGPCNDNEATLGLGDMLGLEALY